MPYGPFPNWDKTDPAGNQSLATSDELLRTNFGELQSALKGVMPQFPATVLFVGPGASGIHLGSSPTRYNWQRVFSRGTHQKRVNGVLYAVRDLYLPTTILKSTDNLWENKTHVSGIYYINAPSSFAVPTASKGYEVVLGLRGGGNAGSFSMSLHYRGQTAPNWSTELGRLSTEGQQASHIYWNRFNVKADSTGAFHVRVWRNTGTVGGMYVRIAGVYL